MPRAKVAQVAVTALRIIEHLAEVEHGALFDLPDS